MVIVVTGGAGFIGSHVVDLLASRGHSVRVLDALVPAGRGKPDYLRDDVDYTFADLRDREAVEAVAAGADAVSHQAAKVGLGVDLSDTVDYVSKNDLGTAVLLESLHRTGFRGRLVVAGSMVVYGEGRYRCSEHGLVAPGPRGSEALIAGEFDPPCPSCGRGLVPEAVGEETPTDPRNVYAATKLHQEHLCSIFGRETGCSVATLRYHNVYGPRMPLHTPYAGVASIFRSSLMRGEAPHVFEDGRQIRDFVHVLDVARANVLALESSMPGAFNVASGSPRTIWDIAVVLSRALAHGTIEPVVTGQFRMGDVRHVFGSTERASQQLGFTASVGFDAGIAAFATA